MTLAADALALKLAVHPVVNPTLELGNTVLSRSVGTLEAVQLVAEPQKPPLLLKVSVAANKLAEVKQESAKDFLNIFASKLHRSI